MNGRHRWTKTGMRQEIDHLRAQLRAEQSRSARLADELALCQADDRETKRLEAALRAWESRWANAHPVSVPAPRDLRPADDRPTQPTDVSKVRAVHRVYAITERPDAANPANIPAA